MVDSTSARREREILGFKQTRIYLGDYAISFCHAEGGIFLLVEQQERAVYSVEANLEELPHLVELLLRLVGYSRRFLLPQETESAMLAPALGS